jgi:hypothetical protein
MTNNSTLFEKKKNVNDITVIFSLMTEPSRLIVARVATVLAWKVGTVGIS